MSERLTTYHCGKAVIKDKNKLSEAMEKLAKLEAVGFHVVRGCLKMKAIYWYRSKMQQCRILQGMRWMNMETEHFILAIAM